VSGVLALGETMAAFRSHGPWRLGGGAELSIAGSESNVAIGVARLGWPARWVGVVGADEFGELVLRTLRAEGVDTSAVRVDDTAPTGLIFFEHRLEGVVRVAYRRRGSAGSTLRPEDVEAGLDGGVDLVVLSGITPALGDAPRSAARRALELAREASTPVVLDVNFRSTLWTAEHAREALAELAAGADIVVASEEELALVAPQGGGPQHGGSQHGDAAEGGSEEALVGALLDAGRREVLVKRAAAGATVFSEGGSWNEPAPKVSAVDTIGAGDAFVAGYCTALLEELPPPQRLARAAACGAFAVASRGDWEGLPRRDELGLLQLAPGAAQR
jgi:2-dehydro-3-deoxygluconokinase